MKDIKKFKKDCERVTDKLENALDKEPMDIVGCCVAVLFWRILRNEYIPIKTLEDHIVRVREIIAERKAKEEA